MANITKRMARKLAGHLADGEQPVVALLVEPKGTYGLGAIAMVTAPSTASHKLIDRAAASHQASGGMAAGFPGVSAVVMVTDRRVIAAPSNGLKVAAPTFEAPLGSVMVKSITRKGMARRVELAFADGSGVAVDAGNLQPFDRFTEALGTAP